MILCLQCGYHNNDSSRFCTFCGSRLTEEDCPVACLILLGETAQKEYMISEAERYVGRDSSNDIVLEDDQASSRHMKIVYEEKAFSVEDLGSRNGTYVNGEHIAGPRVLANGDLIKIGKTIFRFVV